MRVLVTGGAGFIGSNLCAALLDAGHHVGVIDDLSTGRAENLDERSWFRELDILDPALETVLAEFEPETVVHLAAQASVSASIKDPARDWAVNAEGTAAVARAADAVGVRRMISASSAAVYGEPAVVPLAESSPKAPANPYGRSKLAAEGMLADALYDSGTDFASFRFANVYGPRQDALGEGGVVALFCHALASGSTPADLRQRRADEGLHLRRRYRRSADLGRSTRTPHSPWRCRPTRPPRPPPTTCRPASRRA